MLLGDCPAHFICKMTWGGEISGNASSAVFLIDHTEAPMIKSVNIKSKNLFLTLRAISFSIIFNS
jgi:hypothetical protein